MAEIKILFPSHKFEQLLVVHNNPSMLSILLLRCAKVKVRKALIDPAAQSMINRFDV